MLLPILIAHCVCSQNAIVFHLCTISKLIYHNRAITTLLTNRIQVQMTGKWVDKNFLEISSNYVGTLSKKSKLNPCLQNWLCQTHTHTRCDQKALPCKHWIKGSVTLSYEASAEDFSTSFPGFSPTRSMGAGRREPWERGWGFLSIYWGDIIQKNKQQRVFEALVAGAVRIFLI